MALKLTQNGVTFNNIVSPNTVGNSKYNYEKYKDKTTGEDVTRNSTEISDPANKFINAIDIDWNSAQVSLKNDLEPRTINTTGDLLKAVQDASNVGGVSTDTTINASIDDLDTSDKKLIVTDSNDVEKFKIELTTDTNNSDIAIIKMTAGNKTAQTVVPGVTIDDENRKMIWTNTAGQESDKAIQFGNLDIIAVFESLLPRNQVTGGRYVPMVFDEDISQRIEDGEVVVDYPILVGDLILALGVEDNAMHLWVCKESDYDDVAKTGTTAYFTDLGVFPGNNITLSASNIQITGIDPSATGGNNVSNVQEALEYLLYYTTINPADVANLQD